MSATLTRREQQIIDLADQGRSDDAISRELKIARGYVRATIRNFSFRGCWGNSVKFEKRAREGNRRYVAALTAAGMCRS